MKPVYNPILVLREPEEKINIGLRVYATIYAELEELAKISGMKTPVLIRHAINKLIQEHR